MLEIPVRNPLSLELAGLPMSLDEEKKLPLDIDSDLEEDFGHWALGFEGPRSTTLKDHGPGINPNSSVCSHTCHQEEFLDVLSEELSLDDEHEMGNQAYICGMAMNYITEPGVTTEPITQHVNMKGPNRGDMDSGAVFDELMLMDEGMEAGFADDSAPRTEATILMDTGEKPDNGLDDIDEALFMELIT